MAVECVVILVLILVMSYMIFRTGRAGQAVAVTPLMVVPAFHLIGIALSGFLSQLVLHWSTQLFQISFDVAGLVIACVLYGLLAGNMQTRRGRRGYMILCGVFSAVLTIVLVNATLPL